MTLALAPIPPLEPMLNPPQDRDATTALLFPGAGGSACDLNLVWAIAPELAARAVIEVGADPFRRAECGTRFRHPAMYCASIAAWMRLGRPETGFVAGYATGEFAALAAAGAFSIEEGLRLVALRGRLLQEAFESAPPGGMIRVSGLPEQEILALGRRHGLVIAGDNCPGEVAFAGDSIALWAACTDAVTQGGRCVRLEVPRAFDSTAIVAAAAEFEAALRDADIQEPRPGTFSCTAAAPFDDVRARLVESLVKPIEWRSTLLALHEAGVRRFVDVGPSDWMAKLIRRTLPTAEIDSSLAA
jgi:acyl transferase domain-containing protein